MLPAVSDSGVCLPTYVQARVCNKATRKKGVRPTPTLLHTCTFLICHPHCFNSLSLCILIIRISDNQKSFFYPNDFKISEPDCTLFDSSLIWFLHSMLFMELGCNHIYLMSRTVCSFFVGNLSSCTVFCFFVGFFAPFISFGVCSHKIQPYFAVCFHYYSIR